MRRFQKHNSGSIAVEFAFITPVLLMLFYGIFEVSRVLWTQHHLYESLRVVTQYALNHPNDTPNFSTLISPELTQSVTYSCANTLSDTMNWSNSSPDCTQNAMEYVKVSLSTPYTPLFGNIHSVIPAIPNMLSTSMMFRIQ